MRAIGVVRRMLEEFTDEQIYQGDFPPPTDGAAGDYNPSRFHFYEASGYGNTVVLYGDGDHEYEEAMEVVDQSTLWVRVWINTTDMAEHLPDCNVLDVFAGEVSEVIRDSHPDIVNGWDEGIRLAFTDGEDSKDWTDYRTVEGAWY
ncbi:MAG: hypothetical protein H0U76_13920 [Ktedonobacteraceae bacterium]|nr:hypothetical protein [Ktedonobacteraceae bacterium]